MDGNATRTLDGGVARQAAGGDDDIPPSVGETRGLLERDCLDTPHVRGPVVGNDQNPVPQPMSRKESAPRRSGTGIIATR
jgi:hypothetical protein